MQFLCTIYAKSKEYRSKFWNDITAIFYPNMTQNWRNIDTLFPNMDVILTGGHNNNIAGIIEVITDVIFLNTNKTPV